MKRCNNCDGEIDLTLRTLFSKTLIIKNVPVYSCDSCSTNEVAVQDKKKLKKIIFSEIKRKENIILFEKYSEFAQLLLIALNKQAHPISDNNVNDEIMKLLEYYNTDQIEQEMNGDDEIHKGIYKLVH